MKKEQFEIEFFSQVARFLLLFGGFWVVFTALIMVLLEGRTYMEDPWSGVLSLLSLCYVAKVFWRFYTDVKRKVDDKKYQFVSNWRDFLLDAGVLGILTFLQFQSSFQVEGNLTVSQFNTVSNVFLSLIFHFFRFVYHMISSAKNNLL